MQLLQQFAQFDARAGIQAAGRFVQQQQLGVVQQNSRDAQSLFHAPRQSVDLRINLPAQIGQRQDIPAGSIIDFGRVQRGTSKIIAVSIENRSAGTMTVKSMQFSGSTLFSTANAPAFPLTLNPTEVSVFNLQFSPSASVPYSAAITLDSQTVPLTGTGFDPPFSKLSIIVDASLVSSIQPSLSITLDQPAPTAATGTLTLGFQPSVGGGDDTAIRFMAAGGRVLSFSFNAGDTTATIGTSRTASFQTGTTAGTLTFAAVFQNATTQAVSKVQPQAVQIESTISNRPNNVELRIQLTGYDNSKSASQLAFTFYDSAGATIQPGRIAFNATTDFTQFFATSSTGGLFSLLADFPVKGAANSVSSVDVELTNSAGVTTLSKLLFSPCVPVITTPCPNATGCPCT